MKRTPEQVAARKERQYQTSLMNKCSCGNVASVGEPLCGRCKDESFHREKVEELKEGGIITVGEYTIGPSYGDDEKSISIMHSSGEGGDFNREAFIELIAEFYRREF